MSAARSSQALGIVVTPAAARHRVVADDAGARLDAREVAMLLAELRHRQVRARRLAMTGGAEVGAVAGRAAIGIGAGLGAVIDLAPGDEVIARLLGAMALVAGVVGVARELGVAAGARR